jgi:hypothetical protein
LRILDNECQFDPVILIGKNDTNLFFSKFNKNMIIKLLVVTNCVPEVSVIREQRAFSENTKCKSRFEKLKWNKS